MFLRSSTKRGLRRARRIDRRRRGIRSPNVYAAVRRRFVTLPTRAWIIEAAGCGAGILAGPRRLPQASEATRSGDWILQYNFNDYNEIEPFQQGWKNDRYHYGLFNCCQAMYQLGGRHWQQFFPDVVKTLLANQQPDGSWPAENHHHDAQFGNAYTTAAGSVDAGCGEPAFAGLSAVAGHHGDLSEWHYDRWDRATDFAATSRRTADAVRNQHPRELHRVDTKQRADDTPANVLSITVAAG